MKIKLKIFLINNEDNCNIKHFQIVKFKSISIVLLYCFEDTRTDFGLMKLGEETNQSKLYTYNKIIFEKLNV